MGAKKQVIDNVKDTLKARIRGHEGLSLTPYEDDYAGTTRKEYSIGYGHQIQPNEEYLMNGITKERAEEILDKDISWFTNFVSSRIIPDLNEAQLEALVNLCYAIGPGAFQNSKAVYHINHNGTKDEIIEDWKVQGIYWKGKKINGLVKMRLDEIDLFFDQKKSS
ncbi:MAG: lysozyme [Bacilli bacterium]|jgi:lysozyme